jgi:hypothetical protein
MSDAAAVAALLVAIDSWENRDRVGTPVALGFTAGFRLGGVFAVAGFALAILDEVRRRRRELIWLATAVIAAVGAVFAVASAAGGSAYAEGGIPLLDGRLAGENLALYLGGLALLPPFPLVLALVWPSRVERWAWVAVPVLAFFVPYSYHDVSPNALETLVGGQRLALPAHAAMLVATMRIWSAAPLLRRRWVTLTAGAAVGIAGSLAMAKLEAPHRPAVEVVAACRPQRIGYDIHAARVAGSIDAGEYHLLDGRDPAGFADLVVVAGRMLTHRPVPPADLAPELVVHAASCRRVGAYAIYDLAGRCPPGGETCR